MSLNPIHAEILEKIRREETEFLELKTKYQVDSYPDSTRFCRLYPILKKLDQKLALDYVETNWLNLQSGTYLCLASLLSTYRDQKNKNDLDRLKEKFKAIHHPSFDPNDQLFAVLKRLDLGRVLESDIFWLEKECLFETAAISRLVLNQSNFQELKEKYGIGASKIPENPFYELLLKLENRQRLDPKSIILLKEKRLLVPLTKIAIAYHESEALFYEKEYQQTRNGWCLASASSQWRKANQPEKALTVTEIVNSKAVKPHKLRAALLVTRGATFRDLKALDKAEKCAKEAMRIQSEKYEPYTLMGAICYDLQDYTDGDHYFKKAEERGAKPKDIDNEIKQSVKNTKQKNLQVQAARYLFNKDPDRYAWAKCYLKES